MKDIYCLMTFYSISFAVKFEKVLKEKGITVKLIPVPRKISSSCGLSGRFNPEEKEKIIQICKDNMIEYEGIYQI